MIQDQPYNISGIVVDKLTKQPLIGVKISYNENTTLTNSDGEFNLNGVATTEDFIQININASSYVPQTKSPYTGDNKVKNNLGVVELISNKTNLELEKLKSSQLDNNLVQNIIPKDASSLQQKTLNNTINNLKSILIPSILGLIAQFGVTNALDFINSKTSNIDPSCPQDIEVLKGLISKRNKLAKQLNNLYKTVDITTKALGLLDITLTTFTTTFTFLKALPIPTPPPPSPSLVPPIQDLKPGIDSNIKKFTTISSGLLILLTTLRDSIQQALDLLKLLDQFIQNCTTDAELTEVNEELRVTNQTSPPTTAQINGFTMDVETENTTNDLKRKRAIAKNNQGVILLRGEYSYSSSDQILIDELVFYIQTNDLKAD